ncbi:MAG: hypothetical protein BGO55_04225 [Sphingobacteriales bacterium 50-39]|nr:hypothetical protein [Sphingobacteriales bacterium]OJW55839.1 MAG: hypothetical protein BGO55_04225 [Sphingobacteriales bacterium 50-39]
MALSLSKKNSLFIWICIFLCLLPFVILSFFNVIAYDDYAGIGAFDKYGFLKTQQLIYTYWEGRFTATFICGVCVKLGILTHYYYLVFFLWAIFSWGAIFFFLRSINTYFLNRTFSRQGIVQASLILFILDIYVMVEMSSGIYWFSPTAVYQTAFILFITLMGCLIRQLSAPVRPGKRAAFLNTVILLLCILIAGSNEVISIALVCFFILLTGIYRYYGSPIPRSLFLYLGVLLLAGVTIMLSSGTLSFRQQLMQGHTGYAGVVPILLFRVLAIFYYVLKEPLFWAVSGTSFALGMRAASIPSLSGFVAALKSRPFFIRGIAAVLLLMLFVLAPILWVTRGSIPERALNDMTSLAAFGLLAVVFLLGVGNPSLSRIVLPMKHLSTLIIVVLTCGLLASYNYKEAWKNVITGYFYHAIQKDRQKIFEAARERHERVTTILSYEAALDEKVRQLFPHGAPVTLQRWLAARPTLLYFDNEAEDHTGPYLRQFYGLDSILVRSDLRGR